MRPINDDLDDEIDLYKLAQVIWRQKWIIAAITLLTIIGAITYLNIASYNYTVTLKVVPVEKEAGGLVSRFGGFASLAGVSVPGDDAVSQFGLYKELLTGLETAERVSQRAEVMRVVFAGEWNAQKNEWMEPTGVLKDLKGQIKSTLGIPVYPWQPPDGRRLKEYLKDAITITKSRDTAVTSVSINVRNVSFGKDLLWALHEIVDASLRDLALEKARRHIDYVRQLLTKVTMADYRQALIEVLSTQEKSRMLASSELFFAADPLGVPTATLRPTKPKPAAVLVLSLVLGLLAGILVVLIRNWTKKRGKESGTVSSGARETEPG